MKLSFEQMIRDLRTALHAYPEVSGQESTTKDMLIIFLRQNTTLELHACGDGFYAAYRSAESNKPSIALRADYDALALPNGGAAHLCGHDGHAASLCGVALLLEQRPVSRDVFLLFQPAEETGSGALGCTELFQQETIGEIYGAHNLPGFPLGQITTRPGTFACASRGISLRFTGKATHAAYPEQGLSPSTAVGQFLCALPSLSAPSQYGSMTLCTVIGVQMGEKTFGSAASEAEVWLTLRAEQENDLCQLLNSVLTCARELAAHYRLGFTYSEQDIFPATDNTPDRAEKVLRACNGVRLEVPMRWSEDFGHYLHHCPGAFFGVGAGVDHPPLHTENYEYPDELLTPTVDAFWKLILA